MNNKELNIENQETELDVEMFGLGVMGITNENYPNKKMNRRYAEVQNQMITENLELAEDILFGEEEK